MPPGSAISKAAARTSSGTRMFSPRGSPGGETMPISPARSTGPFARVLYPADRVTHFHVVRDPWRIVRTVVAALGDKHFRAP